MRKKGRKKISRREVELRYLRKETYKDMAMILGCSETTIYDIVRELKLPRRKTTRASRQLPPTRNLGLICYECGKPIPKDEFVGKGTSSNRINFHKSCLSKLQQEIVVV